MARKRRKARRDRASARRRAEQHSTGGLSTLKLPDGLSMWIPKAQKYLINIIEYEVGQGNQAADPGQYHYERTFWTHPRIGVEEKAYVCPAKTVGKSCPICETRAKLTKDPHADEQLIKDLKPKERQIFLIYDHSDEDKGLQLYESSYYAFGERLDIEIKESDEEDGFETFASPEPDEGLSLRISYDEKSFAGRSFVKCERIQFKRLVPTPEEVLQQVVCLDDLLIVLEYDQLKKIFLDVEEDDDDDDDEEEQPKARRGRKSKAKKEEPEDDDEDWDEDEEDDDDDEESEDEDDWDEDEEDVEEEEASKPKRGAKKKTTRKTKAKKEEPEEDEDEEEHEDDWDDDWENEDEEEEEKPTRKRRGRRG